MPRRLQVLSVLVTVLALLATACNGGDGDNTADSAGDGELDQRSAGEQTDDAAEVQDGADDPDDDNAAADGSVTEQATGEGDDCASIDFASPPDAPVTIRMGNGVASEEPLWLVEIADDIASNQGSWYDLELTPFRANEDRLAAYQAGELDAASAPPQALVRANAQGVALTPVAVILREGEEGYNTTFIANADSGITGIDDLPGRTIAIVDIGSHLDFLAKVAVDQAGADPESGAQYVVLPFPAQPEALAGGQVDVAGLPEPFYSSANASGDVVDIFRATEVTGFPFDVLNISFRPEFIDENLGAVCAFIEDFKAATNYYRDNRDEARTRIHEAPQEFVPIPLEVYLQVDDYERPVDGQIDLAGMQRLIEEMVTFGIIQEDQAIDPAELIRPGVSVVAES